VLLVRVVHVVGGRPRNDPGQPWCGDALLARRLLAGLTLRDVARVCGVTYSTVWRWELSDGDGGHAPRRGQVVALARLFGCSVDAFRRRPRDAASRTALRLAGRKPRTPAVAD